MRNAKLILPITLFLLAPLGCSLDSYAPGGTPTPGSPTPGTMNPESPGSDGGAATPAGTAISSDTMWSGTETVSSDVTVNAGATLTVAAGTQVSIAAGAKINVLGTIKVNGTAQSRVSFAAASDPWGGIVVASGGSANISNAILDKASTPFTCSMGATACLVDHSDFTNFGSAASFMASATFDHVLMKDGNDGLNINVGASDMVKFTNCTLNGTGGDAFTVSGGQATLSYSEIYGRGPTDSGAGGDHCSIHINGQSTLFADHNNIHDTSWGLMYALSASSQISDNNFENVGTFIDPQPNHPKIDGNYFSGTKSGAASAAPSFATNNAPGEISGNGPQP